MAQAIIVSHIEHAYMPWKTTPSPHSRNVSVCMRTHGLRWALASNIQRERASEWASTTTVILYHMRLDAAIAVLLQYTPPLCYPNSSGGPFLTHAQIPTKCVNRYTFSNQTILSFGLRHSLVQIRLLAGREWDCRLPLPTHTCETKHS